jgi:site-specific DNA recombinase
VHAPLITLETYDQIQDRRQGRAKAPNRENIGDDFALRGIALCNECCIPLRSSWSKGRNRLYPYYLCHTKDCEAYGKSIARDRLEDDVGDIIKTLQPQQEMMSLAAAMFKAVWSIRHNQAQEIKATAKRELVKIDKEILKLVDLIMTVSHPTVIRTYEDRINRLERDKLILAEKMANQVEPSGSFEGKLEPALTFLASPWKLWNTGEIGLRRLVPKLAFADRIRYCRKQGARTAEISFPFKALGGVSQLEFRNGGA